MSPEKLLPGIRSPEDLRHVPVSTRDQLRAAGKDGVGRRVDLEAGHAQHTSGASG